MNPFLRAIKGLTGRAALKRFHEDRSNEYIKVVYSLAVNPSLLQLNRKEVAKLETELVSADMSAERKEFVENRIKTLKENVNGLEDQFKNLLESKSTYEESYDRFLSYLPERKFFNLF